MINNENLAKKNYYYQETKGLYSHERSKAKKHLYYSQLRLKFLEWLERGYMDEMEYTFETTETNFSDNEEAYAWQEAVVMFADEVREDGFYVDIIGQTKNYTIHLGLGKPRTKEEKDEMRKLIEDLKEDMLHSKIPYQDLQKLNSLFHSIMNMKTKEDVIFHPRYDEFKKMINSVVKKGDSYQTILVKLTKAQAHTKKSLLETFLLKK